MQCSTQKVVNVSGQISAALVVQISFNPWKPTRFGLVENVAEVIPEISRMPYRQISHDNGRNQDASPQPIAGGPRRKPLALGIPPCVFLGNLATHCFSFPVPAFGRAFA